MTTRDSARKPKGTGYLDRPISPLGCVGGTLIWAVLVSLPVFVFILAARGELGWRRSDLTYDRLFLLNSAEAAGLGYERARVVDDRRATDGPVCVTTQVTYWLFRGEGQSAKACECYSSTGESLGSCP